MSSLRRRPTSSSLSYSPILPDKGEDEPVAFSLQAGGPVWAARAFGSRSRTRVHLSVEWFDRAGVFTVLDAAPIPVPGTSDSVSSDTTYGLASLTNVAVGLEHEKSERVKLYGSFRTDYSGAEAGSNSTLSTWNIYHVGAGLSLKVGKSSVTMGAVYAWGSAPLLSGPLLPPEANLPVLPQPDASYRAYTILIGFNFPYAKRGSQKGGAAVRARPGCSPG